MKIRKKLFIERLKFPENKLWQTYECLCLHKLSKYYYLLSN